MNATLLNALLPSKCCILCNKTHQEAGGCRITAQALRGSTLSASNQADGDKQAPRRSFELEDGSDKYVVVWGDESIWTASVVEKLKSEYLAGFQPWFCQSCGHRVCDTCGAPLNHAMGSDIIKDDGQVDHFGSFPFAPGCNNQNCEMHKPLGGK